MLGHIIWHSKKIIAALYLISVLLLVLYLAGWGGKFLAASFAFSTGAFIVHSLRQAVNRRTQGLLDVMQDPRLMEQAMDAAKILEKEIEKDRKREEGPKKTATKKPV